MRRRATLLAAGLSAGLAWSCSSGVVGSGMGEKIRFSAPSPPDVELLPMVQDVDIIGVLSTTNIAPVQSLDIEKVMGRLTDATARGLRNLQDRTVITQDEIRWHFRDITFDSTMVFSDSLQQALRSELEVDAMVYITLRSLDAKVTPVSPSAYGTAPSPGLNLSVELELMFVNLHSGQQWSQAGRRSSWQPVQVDLMGGGRDPTERQMLMALASPLRQFLTRLAPPPRRQTRQFDTSGD
ncbi:MAG TPA: hypothetical protein QGF95_04720 [Candidatus Latescibacteria bacterium]|nr:hypothetical protein [Candidatus Latescibacterota bacterium]HJP29838.1 hypothetical protein [Candidatus Latescibacterota bacterium]